MKIFDRINQIIEKGINSMKINDQFDLISCYDELLELKAKYKNELQIKNQEIKDFEANRNLELKEERSDDNRKKYTELEIKSLVVQERKHLDSEANVIAYMLEKIDGKQKAVYCYITCVRDWLRPNVVLTQGNENVG